MDWLRDHLWETWLAVAVLLGIAELFSLDLFLAMLAVGALAGMGTALVGAPFVVQALVAAGVSVATIGFVRPALARRLHGGPDLPSFAERLVGESAIVTAEISGYTPGRVRLSGEIWTAEARDKDVVLTPGDPVEVVEIRGATAIVAPTTPPAIGSGGSTAPTPYEPDTDR
jgi:membrane protein implicated in regulation of membrane protease activity